MKTIEEKAKAYDEALGWMRELYPGLHGATKEDAEHYFPELRESEDERAIQFLKGQAIEFIESLKHDISMSTYDGIEGHDPEAEEELEKWRSALAWLDKQKESLHISESCKENADSLTDDERIRKGLLGIFKQSQNGNWGGMEIKDIVAYLERQKEKKPELSDDDEEMNNYKGREKPGVNRAGFSSHAILTFISF